MNRRDWFKGTLAGAAALAIEGPQQMVSVPENTASEMITEIGAVPNAQEIHRLLGFATMTGESPLTMWGRLHETKQWLAGPLAPDAWAGQVFIADHADIFAFRFLSLPESWMAGVASGKRAEFAAKNFSKWFAGWPS